MTPRWCILALTLAGGSGCSSSPDDTHTWGVSVDSGAPMAPSDDAGPDGRPSPGKDASSDGRSSPDSSSDAHSSPDAYGPAPDANDGAAPGTSTLTQVAPYFPSWTWGDPSTYPYANLVDLRNKTGVKAVTLAFVLAGTGCAPDGTILSQLSDIQAFEAAGGHVKASFGGQLGTYVEYNCADATSLAQAIGSFVDQSGIVDLDFDIEQDQAYGLSTMRGQALQQVQASRGIQVSFTLSTNTAGLDPGAVQVVQGAVGAGVTISHVNLMTMDYVPPVGMPLGPVAIGSLQGASAQLRSMIPGLTASQAYAMLGATAMIGVNDNGDTFSLADATQLVQFARNSGLGLLSFWSIDRDRVCSTGKDDCSTVNTAPFEFFDVFATAQQ